MSNLTNDGGPAFALPGLPFHLDGAPQNPFAGYGWAVDPQPGMSTRAWMTGKILAGFAANPAVFAANGMSGWSLVNCNEDDLAGYSARLADEAIKALQSGSRSGLPLTTPFETWWNNEGSGMAPLPGEDAEQHVRRVTEIAWSNGMFSAAPALRQIHDRTEGYADGAPDASPHDRLCNEIAELAKGGIR